MVDLQPFEVRSAEHLRLVLDNSQIGIWELDLESGVAVRNRTHDQIFGYDRLLGEWSYDLFLSHVVERDRDRVDGLQKTAINENRDWIFECQIVTAKGERRWIKASGRPLLNDKGEAHRLIGHVLDITEAKTSEAMLHLVTDELRHRVRNILGIVKSMIRLTANRTESASDFAQALEGRVGALARSQDFIVGTASRAMTPSAILGAEFDAFRIFEGQTSIVAGKEAELCATASKGLALVAHELLTNATKYGALSVATGTVEVTVDLHDNETIITWLERGGPPPADERAAGFGSMLIDQALAGDGHVERVFSPEGLECRITITTG